MNTLYTIDLSLQPTTFDLWHVCLAATVAILALLLIVSLGSLVVMASRRCKSVPAPTLVNASPPEPKIIEKIVEVEKIVHAPTPEPIILKESTPEAALQLLAILQKEARFIDFIKEDIAAFSDADIGIAARVVHEGCNKAINEHFTLNTLRSETEGSKITIPKEFDANQIRLTGNIIGQAPFTGTLIHKGWQVTDMHLPKLTQSHNPSILAAAEVEL